MYEIDLQDSGACLSQTLPVTGPGQPVWTYQQSTACDTLYLAWVCKKESGCVPRLDFTLARPRGGSAEASECLVIHFSL